jgi:hypothetical protein
MNEKEKYEIKDLILRASSMHLFKEDFRVIFKFPLNNAVNELRVGEDIYNYVYNYITENISHFRSMETKEGIIHAIVNPLETINFEVPTWDLFKGKAIVFGEVGSGKSTLLSTIGRHAVNENKNVFTVEDPLSLNIKHATHLINDKETVNTILLCRPDIVLFDEVRTHEHYKQLKQLSLACSNIIGSFHATEIFQALARFSSLNSDRSYGELSTIADLFIQVNGGNIVNWFKLETKLNSELTSEFYVDGQRPVTVITDKNNAVIGHIFYFANDINIVKVE